MPQTLTGFEKFMLSQPIPALALAGLENPTDIDLWERAAEIGYAEKGFCERGEGNLRALAMILGVLPSTYEERLAFCGGR